MICRLPYGRERIALDLRGFRVRALRPSGPVGAEDPGALVGPAVDAPLDGPPLEALARRHDRATIVVPDATRSAALPRTLPPLLERLCRAGIAAESTTVLVACGTHPPVSEARCAELVGPLPAGIRVIQHDSRASGDLLRAGRLSDGRWFHLSRWVVNEGMLVTLSVVRHHYFAGFGGGPKMVFPGAGAHDEIQQNHSRVLVRDADGWHRHAGCEPGRTVGNPVYEEIAAVADLHPPDMAVCLVPAASGGFSEALAGPWRTAFDRAASAVRAAFEVPEGPFDLMVASGGGDPSDSTLIQAHKGLDAACRFAADGAEILFVASLGLGPGSPAMDPFLDDPRPEAILDRLGENWVQYGHTTLRLVEKAARFRIHVHSSWDAGSLARIGFVPAPNPREVLESWRDRFAGATVGVMADGLVYPATS